MSHNKKNRKVFSIFLFIILVLTAVVICYYSGLFDSFKQNNLDMSVYEGFTDKHHVYESMSIEDTETLLKEGTGIIYIGRKDCAYCVKLVPVLNKTAKSYKISPVYYLDVSPYDSNKDFHDALDAFLEKIKYYYDGEPVTPTLIAVKGGKIIDFIFGEETEERINKLFLIYKGEEDSTFKEYKEPAIKVKEEYGELILYTAGEEFDIRNFVDVTAYKDRVKDVYFSLQDEEDHYSKEGTHPITITVEDDWGNTASLDSILLTESEEVIDILTKDDH